MGVVQMREQIQRSNDDLFAAWNKHDADAVAALYSEDAIMVDVVSGVTTQTRDSICTYARARFSGFPDFRVERSTLVIDGSECASTWLMSGTNNGEYEGLQPTSREVVVAGTAFHQFDYRCLITRDTHYTDVPGYLRQLGLPL